MSTTEYQLIGLTAIYSLVCVTAIFAREWQAGDPILPLERAGIILIGVPFSLYIYSLQVSEILGGIAP